MSKINDDISLLDYFAGQALAGVLSSGTADCSKQKWRVNIAINCYEMAQAMLGAREKAADMGTDDGNE